MSKHLIDPDKCTACTVCVAHCPVTAATREFRGPKMTGPALERLRLQEQDEDPSLEFCSNCKNCDISCPSGVPVSTLNMLARAKYYENHPHKMRDDMLSHGERMGNLLSSLPGAASIVNLGMSIGKSTGMMDMIGMASKSPLPKYSSSTFYQQFKKIHQTSYKDKVVFFPGCFINFNDPQVGIDFVGVMQKNRIEVIVDESFVCCGSPLLVNGYLSEVKENAVKNTTAIKGWIDKGYPILTCCTSCGLMLKQEYQELFGMEQAKRNAEFIFDSMEYLSVLNDKNQLDTDFSAIQEQYIYHVPCHLRSQGLGLPALEILSLIPGIKIENANAGCCGISGSYGFKADKYEIAMKVGQKLFNRIEQSGADKAISDCGTCRLQIGHGAHVKTAHPISIVKQAYKKF